jgi:hypothetical protein
MNRATRIIVSTIGIILALAGIDHGIFEILQGNTSTPGLVIQSIGDAQQMWFYGTEEAFTIIPNFLVTGILSILTSIAILVWSIGFVGKKYGAAGFILLFVLLFLVGGGIAQVVFFLPTWAVATRIHKPLTWWKKVLPEGSRRILAKVWPVTLTAGAISFLIGLYIAIFGTFPGMNATDPEQVLSICWSFIFGGGLGMFVLSYISGFAHDIRNQIKKEA